MNLEERISAFSTLTRANDDALGLLAQIGSETTDDPIDELFKHINVMGECLATIMPYESEYYGGKCFPDYFKSLCARIDEIQKDAAGKKIPAELLAASDITLSPEIKEKIAKNTLQALYELNEALEGSFDPQEVSLDDLATPHDAIRYMHQAAMDSLFDPNGEQWQFNGSHAFVYEKGDMNLVLMSAGKKPAKEIFMTNPFLSRYREIADTGRYSMKAGHETFYTLAADGMLSMQMKLGCHYATIKIRESGSKQRISFKYTDTSGYSSSKFRANMTQKILMSIGYDVSRKDNVMWVDKEFKSSEAVDEFETLFRLAVSLRDVDMLPAGMVKGREDDAVRAFRVGAVNLRSYLGHYDKGQYVHFAKSEGTYLFHNMEIPEDVLAICGDLEDMVDESAMDDSESAENAAGEEMGGSETSQDLHPIMAYVQKAKAFWKSTEPNYTQKTPWHNVREMLWLRGFKIGVLSAVLCTGGSFAKGCYDAESIQKFEEHDPSTYESTYIPPAQDEYSVAAEYAIPMQEIAMEEVPE